MKYNNRAHKKMKRQRKLYGDSSRKRKVVKNVEKRREAVKTVEENRKHKCRRKWEAQVQKKMGSPTRVEEKEKPYPVGKHIISVYNQ